MGHLAKLEVKKSFIILTGNPTGKSPLGRPRRRCENNIRMDLKEIRISSRDWTDWANESPCECGIEPPDFISHGDS